MTRLTPPVPPEAGASAELEDLSDTTVSNAAPPRVPAEQADDSGSADARLKHRRPRAEPADHEVALAHDGRDLSDLGGGDPFGRDRLHGHGTAIDGNRGAVAVRIDDEMCALDHSREIPLLPLEVLDPPRLRIDRNPAATSCA